MANMSDRSVAGLREGRERESYAVSRACVRKS